MGMGTTVTSSENMRRRLRGICFRFGLLFVLLVVLLEEESLDGLWLDLFIPKNRE